MTRFRPFPLLIWGLPVGAALGAIALPTAALAHGAHIELRATQALEIQAMYDSGEPMKGAQVQVFSPQDPRTPYLTGLTDDRGHFAFTPTSPGNWEVSVRQAGHGDIKVIPVEVGGAIATSFTTSSRLSPLQRGIMAAAVTWGCVGTALYFWRGKR
jgi:nickel transport protein